MVIGRKEALVFAQLPAEPSGEPSEEQESGGAPGAGDGNSQNISNPGQGTGVIKELRKRKTGTEKPRPIQIAKNRPNFGERSDLLDQSKLLLGSFPARAVVDQAVDSAPMFL